MRISDWGSARHRADIRVRRLGAATALIAAAVASGEAWGDDRYINSFTGLMEYTSVAAGATNVAYHFRQVALKNAADTMRLQLDVNHGITDRAFLDIGFVVGTLPAAGGVANPFGFVGTVAELNYRLGERGKWPIDICTEIGVKFPFDSTEFEVEAQVSLSKLLGKTSLVLNLGVMTMFGGEDHGVKFVPTYGLGFSYFANKKFRIGAEIYGEIDEMKEASGAMSRTIGGFVGPAIAWIPSANMNLTLGSAVGVFENRGQWQFRVLIHLWFL